MLKVGITGGIGTGKTTVCHLFEKLGVPVYFADDRAHWLTNNNDSIVQALKEAFGEAIYTPEGVLDRPKLGAIVFNDEEKLALLNSIVHPAIFEDSENWQREQNDFGMVYTLKEAALLFETGSYKFLDKIIVVAAPEDLRVQRVMARDNLSKEAVLKRIQSQMPQEEKVKMADFVIENIHLDELSEQVNYIHQQLLNLPTRDKSS